MADEINKNENTQDILGIESDSIEALDALNSVEPDEAADAASELSGEAVREIDDIAKIDESELKLDFDEPKAEAEKEPELKDYVRDTDDKPQRHTNRPRGERSGDARRDRRPQQGGRRRPDGAKRRPDGRPAPNGANRPDGERRKRPDGEIRRRPDGEARRRPDGERRKRPDGAPNGQRKPRPEGAQGVKKKKGWSKKKKTMLIVIVTIVLCVALIVGVLLAVFFAYTGKLNRDPKTVTNSGEAPSDSSQLVSKPDTISKEEQEAKLREMLSKRQSPITNESVTNILIIGEDLRDTADDTQGNTDVQLLVSINKEKKKIVLASFLRDQYLNIEGFGMGRLNTAYWHNGVGLLKDTISNYYNIHIDRYVKVNFYSFMEVIDAIGGVDMEIKDDEFAVINEAVREHNYYLHNPQEKDYIKQKGFQHLNGNQALAYSRIREGCGDDYGRTERQRKMISTVLTKMKGIGIIELDQLINQVAPQITTDITNGEMLSLILNASEITGYQVCQVQMPHYPYFTEEVINRMAVLVPDYDKNSTLLLDMIYGDSTTIDQAIEKMNAGTINQHTYTKNGDQNAQQGQNNGQNTLNDPQNIAVQSKDQIPKLKRSA